MVVFEYYLEDGSRIIDAGFGNYNRGTQLMLKIMVEQDCEFESIIQYGCLVNDLEECRNECDVEEVMYEMGTDYVDELEVQISWMDVMFPRVIESPYLTYIGDEVVN